MEQTKNTIKADRKDRIVAWIMCLMGYGFIYTFTSRGMYQNLKIFTSVYLILVAAYFHRQKTARPEHGSLSGSMRESWEMYFWMLIVGSLGFSFSDRGVIYPLVQILALLSAAAYLVLCAGGNLLEKQKSSQWILVDIWNAFAVVPFSNLLCHMKVLGSRETGEGETEKGQGRAILLGIGITIPILCVVLPLLGAADRHFEEMLLYITTNIQEDVFFTIIRIILAVPVTAYLYGLFYGSRHQRHTQHYGSTRMAENMEQVRIIPVLAVGTVYVIVCLIYLLFIGLQASYLFSAFAGIRPDHYTYAEYARQGFFELCKVAVLNLLILILGNTLHKKKTAGNRSWSWMNVALSGLTLLLILTAMSKMMLYISAYGLTAKRVVTMVFMIWLLVVFTQVIVVQFRKIPLARISLLVGTTLYTLLCVLPISMWIEMFNGAYHSLY